MRTIGNLLALDGRVFVYLPSTSLVNLFLKNAEEEGFTFGEDRKPTESPHADIIALNMDWTLNYVGYVGHLAFGNADTVGGKKLIRMHYGKYLAGRDDYIMKQNAKGKYE